MCGLWHEIMHTFECWRQGCKYGDYIILPDFKHLSLHYIYFGDVTNKDQIKLSGGLYTSIICFILSFLVYGHWNYLGWLFVTFGWVQLCYSIFEWRYISKLDDRQYLLGRYVIYVISVLVNLLIWIFVK